MNLDPKNPVDENELGNAYFWGNEETKQDLKQAVVWYQKAADKGLPIAIFNLAYCYEFGHGVKKDNTEAKRLFAIANKL